LITDPSRASESSWRLPAIELERLVVRQIGEFLSDQNRIWTLGKEAKLSNQEAVSALKRVHKFAQTLRRGPDNALRPLLLRIIRRIVLHADRIVMELSPVALMKISERDTVQSCARQIGSTIVLTTPCQFRRRGGEMRLVIEGQVGGEGRPDTILITGLVRTNAWWRELCSGEGASIKEIACRQGSDERYVARNLKLAFLAPDITAAILEGRQPPHLTADSLIKMSDLPCSWAAQRRRLGFV
jgi:site-specific DNA recombinase